MSFFLNNFYCYRIVIMLIEERFVFQLITLNSPNGIRPVYKKKIYFVIGVAPCLVGNISLLHPQITAV